MTSITDQIYKILLGRSFARPGQSYDHRLASVLQYCKNQNEPIPITGFWGVGSKSATSDADTSVATFFSTLDTKVRSAYPPGLQFTFILACPHGIHNGYDAAQIMAYARAVEDMCLKHGFAVVYLDSLWKKYGISFDVINAKLANQSEGWWKAIPMSNELEISAAKRNIRLPPIIAAQTYYIMRHLEKAMLEAEFGSSIFHTFSDSSWSAVLPNLPTIYFYAGKRGFCSPPWFVDTATHVSLQCYTRGVH